MHAQMIEASHDVEHDLLEFFTEQKKPLEIKTVVQHLTESHSQEETKSAIRYMIETGQLSFDSEFRLVLKN